MQHHLTPKYLSLVGRFETLHPSAYRFLRRLERDGPTNSLCLSTATNAHLYKGMAFLAYLKLNNPDLKPPTLVLSPRFNLSIGEASDQSSLLFPKLVDKLIGEHKGFSERWAVARTDGARELTTKTPDAFFDALFGFLERVEVRR